MEQFPRFITINKEASSYFEPASLLFSDLKIIDKKAETVYVIRILRHEVNWQQLLREALFYTFD